MLCSGWLEQLVEMPTPFYIFEQNVDSPVPRGRGGRRLQGFLPGQSSSSSGEQTVVIPRVLSGECVNDVQISSLQYCNNQGEVHAAVVQPFVLVDVPLVIQLCRRADVHWRRRLPANAAPFCVTRSKLGETEFEAEHTRQRT